MSKTKSNKSALVRFPGIAIALAGDEYIVPPLNLGTLEQMQKRLQDFNGGIDAASVNTVLDATHAALLRNYPEITRDEIAELVDVGNMQEIMQAVMDVSGLRRKALETKDLAPEVAGEGAAPLTSASSTATSPPASAGAGSTAGKT